MESVRAVKWTAGGVLQVGALVLLIVLAAATSRVGQNVPDEDLPEEFIVYDARGEQGKLFGFSNPVARIAGQTFELMQPANRFTLTGNFIRQNRFDGVIVQIRNVDAEAGFPGEEHFGTSEPQFPGIASGGSERTLVVVLDRQVPPGRYAVTLMGSTGVKSSEVMLREFQVPLTDDVYPKGAAYMCSSDGWTCQALGQNGEDFAIRITAELIGEDAPGHDYEDE